MSEEENKTPATNVQKNINEPKLHTQDDDPGGGGDAPNKAHQGNITASQAPATLSKNQLRKLKKKQIWEEVKERKKKAKLEKRLAKGITEIKQELNPEREKQRQVERAEFLEKLKSGIKIVIDCSFEDLMSEKENKSLAQQVMHCYAKNKKSQQPFPIYVTGVSETTKQRLNKKGAGKWAGVDVCAAGHAALFPRAALVYLTADAEAEVGPRLDPEKVYIIGGIVDRNRLKRITIDKAEKEGITAAKLPVDRIISMEKPMKHLTVNHVFEILLNYNHTDSLDKVLVNILPVRKQIRLKEQGKEDDQEEGTFAGVATASDGNKNDKTNHSQAEHEDEGWMDKGGDGNSGKAEC